MGINVLSLFDGMSCGMVVLNRLGVEVDNYYASEVDAYAIKVSKANYPNIQQIGDVRGVQASSLPKIDLLIGGSPCQGFSSAGKQLSFEDPRSKLFFEYVRLLRECVPKWFLLENVVMKPQCVSVISSFMGVKPIKINSAIFSAQNRERLYWSNIPIGRLPKDRGITISDIMEHYKKGMKVGRIVGRRLDANLKRADANKSIPTKQYLELRKNNKSGALTTVQKDNVLCVLVGLADFKGIEMVRRVYSPLGKAPTLTAVCGGHQEKKIFLTDGWWRSLTPLECERLQTLPDNYTNYASKTQRYKMIGNGWNVETIVHVLSALEVLV